MIRRSYSQPRSAFTLIELLIAIAIIALLAALLLPAISKVRTYANRATATSEINQLAAACTKFQGDWGFYPPSVFTIPTRIDQPGYVLLKSKYNRWNPTLMPDMVTIAPASALVGAGQTLVGGQSLVYFMQGPNGTGWAHDGPYVPSSTSALGPYYNFQPNRLVAGNNIGNFGFNAASAPVAYSSAFFYMDPFGSPYGYFGSAKVGGKYNPAESFSWNYSTMSPLFDSTKYVNEKTCQIICAGENGADESLPVGSKGFGSGGAMTPGTGDYASSARGGDDFGNFNGGAPMNRRGD